MTKPSFPIVQVSDLDDPSQVIEDAIEFAFKEKLAVEGIKVIVVQGMAGMGASADVYPTVFVKNLGGWEGQVLLDHARVHAPSHHYCMVLGALLLEETGKPLL